MTGGDTEGGAASPTPTPGAAPRAAAICATSSTTASTKTNPARKVFDAIAPHVAGGGRLYLNYQFARPVTSSQQHTNQLDPELFPHAYNMIKDAQTRRRDGILKRPKTDPLIFHTQTSTEYWQKRGCLAHTDGRGNDLKLPDNVRLYVIASAQHNSPFGSEPAKDDSQFLVNPLPAGDVLRALMVAMDLWATKAIAPPPSRYPSVTDHTLVPPTRNGFPEDPRRKLRRSAQPPTVSRLRQKHSARQDGGASAETRWQWRLQNPRAQSRCRRQRHPRHSLAQSKCPSAPTPAGTCVRAASRQASCRACLDRSFPSLKQKCNGAKPAIRDGRWKNATETELNTFSASARLREF